MSVPADERPTVTVAIPVFNEADHIEACLDAVAAQTANGQPRRACEPPHGEVDNSNRGRQVAACEDDAVSQPQGRDPRRDASTAGGGAVLDDAGGLVPQRVARFHHPEGEVDFLGRVEEVLVISTGSVERLPPRGVGAPTK